MIGPTPYPIPSRWEWTILGEISEIARTQVNPKLRPQDRFNYLSIENIEANSGELVNFTPTLGQKIKSAKIAFTTKDILYSKLRPYLNKVHLPSFDGVSATDLIPIRPLGGIPREYLGYFLRTRYVVEYANQRTRGIQLPRMPVDDLLRLPIPCPPLAEQRRIVTKLEPSLKSIRLAKKALKRIPSPLQEFRQSVLSKAFRGELTERDPNDEPAEKLLERIRQERRKKWEEDLRAKGKDPKKCKYEEFEPVELEGLPKLSEGWSWTYIGAIGNVVTGKTPPTSNKRFYGDAVPFVKPGDLDVKGLVVSAEQFLSDEGARHVRPIPAYSVMVTSIGATIGKTGINGRPVVTNQQINSIVLSPFVDPFFVYYYCLTDFFQDKIRANASSTTLPILNKTRFLHLPISLAPISEQKRIFARIKEAFAKADEIENAVSISTKQIDYLEEAILSRAFRGELVPQDPDDEPASVFLERIRAQRRAIGKKGRPQTRLEYVSPEKTTKS